MHIYKSRFLVRGEVWFEHEPERLGGVDWLLYHQRKQPVAGARWKYFHTVLLDLSQDSETLLRQMSKTNVYKIRRARDRDGIVCESVDPVNCETLDRFEETYKRFAALKGLERLDRQLLDQLAKDERLELSIARNPGQEAVAYHVYYCDSHRSCLLHTVSLYGTLSDSGARNTMGRANRYLFWCDILRHQARGLKVFDFGGWYPGTTDKERLDINRFKEEFGGNVVREYNCQEILTLKGHIVLGAAALLNHVKHAAGRIAASHERKARRETAAEAKRSAGCVSPLAQPGVDPGGELAR